VIDAHALRVLRSRQNIFRPGYGNEMDYLHETEVSVCNIRITIKKRLHQERDSTISNTCFLPDDVFTSICPIGYPAVGKFASSGFVACL
jgi:hypothetical protein